MASPDAIRRPSRQAVPCITPLAGHNSRGRSPSPPPRQRRLALAIVTASTLLLASPTRRLEILAAPPAPSKTLQVVDAKADARITMAGNRNSTTIDVRSESGIGRATIARVGEQWPEIVLLKLHLRGLESLLLTSDRTAVRWSVSSEQEPRTRVTLQSKAGEEQALEVGSRYYSPLRIVSPEPRVPLPQGHFELRIPAALLQESANSLRIEWIDFYRG